MRVITISYPVGKANINCLGETKYVDNLASAIKIKELIERDIRENTSERIILLPYYYDYDSVNKKIVRSGWKMSSVGSTVDLEEERWKDGTKFIIEEL